ncbi:diguanylate cyclase/phosphodiesterase with PAS/PAC sensor(s) [Psychrobacillus psychrotolerans]|uniref:Diguanylate cyclase/phosphodiesterase with PAS/PAC sensor(S) n=1 Tax=Psychrobacillus psychrotolerans TaxID=126156 RepID=A0A1I5VPR3_9BACI|nr:GGDEF domain-containing phosphodiesterase [Psychrobacillus psychrotolerans]SFQ09432.1 diguanylate cyclase/phosphodiesterase with PAS/PAC sensor(s) [Psychrobacillus psychrotolerans]
MKKQPPERLQSFSIELLEQILQSTTEGIMITNEKMQITMVNNAFETLTGYRSSEILGKYPNILQSGKQDADFYKVMWSKIRSNGSWRGEIWNRRKNGEIYPEILSIYSVFDKVGQLTNYYGVFSDISIEKETEKELEELTQSDLLTNILNRNAFNELLFEKVNNSIHSHAILFIDLDRFKQINDTLGNEVGDQILIEVTNRINSIAGSSDIFARYGADEFVFSRSNIEYQKEAANLAKDITKLFNKPFLINDTEVYVTASIGISIFPQDGKDIEKLINKADKAMYFAKQNGRNQYAFYFDDLKKDSKRIIILEAELRKAIQNKDFFIYYQPKIGLAKQDIIGVEALVRWNNVKLGFVSPAEFIPIAEDTGLIIPLSEVILEKVCLDILESRSQGKIHILPVSINIASVHFQQDDFIERINSILMQYNCSPHLLELELTERTVMKDSDDIVNKLVKLKAMGFKISIDDFGTGYSSLSYLNRFPLNYLKIDKSFIQQITNLQDKQAIVETIILMAHRLHIKVVAEGVETIGQVKLLQQMGCDIIQGYYYSKPLAAKELMDFIELWEIYRQERNI